MILKKKIKGPDLEKYLEGRKKRYTTYALGASLYSMNYYSFVKLAKKAGANLHVKRNAIVDLDILDSYITENCKGEEEDE